MVAIVLDGLGIKNKNIFLHIENEDNAFVKILLVRSIYNIQCHRNTKEITRRKCVAKNSLLSLLLDHF